MKRKRKGLDAQKYAEELGMKLELRYPDPSGTTAENEKIEGHKIIIRLNRESRKIPVKNGRPVTCSIFLGDRADGVLSRLSQNIKSRRLKRRGGCMLMQIQLGNRCTEVCRELKNEARAAISRSIRHYSRE